MYNVSSSHVTKKLTFGRQNETATRIQRINLYDYRAPVLAGASWVYTSENAFRNVTKC